LKSSPVYPVAQQRGLPALSYDPTAGHRLLADAGLTRGGDGIYRTVSGVPLAFEMNTTNDIASNIAEMLAIANGWQTNGAQPNQEIVTAKDNKDQIRSTTGQLNLTSTELSYTWFDTWATSQISSEATKWKGGNPIGYSAPAYDSLYGRLYTTLASADRDQVAADLIKYTLDQELYLPLAYSDDVSAYRKGITGMTGVFVGERVTGWNYETWDMQ
jgi:ABC-type transport system substrate-binding protein